MSVAGKLLGMRKRTHAHSHTRTKIRTAVKYTNVLIMIYSLTAGHQGILTQDVRHSNWRFDNRLDCPLQNGTNTYCMQTLKQN